MGKCQRCGSTAHCSKDCSLPFYRQCVTVEAEHKKETPAEYAARHAANQKKKEEWEKKKEEHEKENERRVNADKEVMKWAKKFRDIVKVEGLPNLDALQKQKLARKEKVQLEFEQAKGLVKVRVKDELRK